MSRLIRVEEVYTRDKSSGRVHTRLRYGNRFMVDERCQTDQAGGFEVIDSTDGIEPGALCDWDFPKLADGTDPHELVSEDDEIVVLPNKQPGVVEG